MHVVDIFKTFVYRVVYTIQKIKNATTPNSYKQSISTFYEITIKPNIFTRVLKFSEMCTQAYHMIETVVIFIHAAGKPIGSTSFHLKAAF